MKTSCKTLAWGVLCCATLWAPAAQASPISLSFSGTIQSGYDYTGEFGSGNSDLYGRSVEVRYSFDSALFGTYWSSNGQDITQTVTVGGVSKQYTLEPWNSSANSYISNALTQYGPYNYSNNWWYWWYSNYDQIHQNNSGYIAGGGYLDSYQSVYSYSNPMSPPTDGTASWTYLTQAGDYGGGSFYRYDANWNYTTYFNNSVDRVALNVGNAVVPAGPIATNVPEPATWALVCLALVGVFGTRRAMQRHYRSVLLPPA